ncbi:hypothetical protein FB558_8597 [Pseudonocardia kunmingensis]|uniref:Uncharacterized protein n=1 Tax=Pseudonocardia kunmingensis TaxID=630975 RepID=A0A543CX59_9PSEU|nr:hypothetical protein FB558_8597 [Pseudonocardia kunmingensis]
MASSPFDVREEALILSIPAPLVYAPVATFRNHAARRPAHS